MEQSAIYSALGLGALSVILVLLLTVVGWRLAVRFTTPLSKLTETAARVAAGDFRARAEAGGADELNTLSQAFNTMMDRLGHALSEERARSSELEEAYASLHEAHEELHATQQTLVDASRRAGMAEMAAGVLHNVGNVLNSVNVSASLVAESLRSSKVAKVRPAVAMLDRPPAELASFLSDDARGAQLLRYLRELAAHVEGEHARYTEELERLCQHLEHVKRVLSMHQTYARAGGMRERCVPSTVVEDALRLAISGTGADGVRLTKHLEANAEVLLDRHKVVQIVVNLVRNAVQAVEQTSDPSVSVTAVQRGDEVVIEVADNGSGIAEENKSRIFQHGFTTKRDGHGFGLHSSALAAQDLGGTLSCVSEGENLGARFSLAIPAPVHVARCA